MARFHTFEALYGSIVLADTSPELFDLLRAVHTTAIRAPVDASALRAATAEVLQHLCSPAGRTDANCRTVDFVLMQDDEVWEALEALEGVDDELHDVLADMAGALHDTVSAPEIAANFDSTPELLLGRLEHP
jgi:hypothetical protein